MDNKLVLSILIREKYLHELIDKIKYCSLINYVTYKQYSVVYFWVKSNKLKDLNIIKIYVKYNLEISYYSTDYFILTNEQVDFLKTTKDTDKLLLNDDKVLIDFIVMHYYNKHVFKTRNIINLNKI